MKNRIRVTVTGRVQGVGFRPTVYRYATGNGLTGFVKNAASGVIIEIEGRPGSIDRFLEALRESPPPQAVIQSTDVKRIPANGSNDFQIIASQRSGDLIVGMPPDLATCDDCRSELLNPTDRRYRYPFINCTNCGPRFTIIRELPYDRPYTSMSCFKMCAECRREYADPADRRFDAQPDACALCGPSVKLIDPAGNELPGDPVQKASELIRSGHILAVKGLGGYHLCCLATDDAVVKRLRERKRRPAKSLAVMFCGMDEIESHCIVNRAEARELNSYRRPIVILQRRPESALSELISPDTNDTGAFLPYTSLHILLLAGSSPLVMTSGNLSEEPIVKDEEQLPRILGPIADFALTHNRSIVRRCDDSVLRISDGKRVFYRRSRGFVPERIPLPLDGPTVLACGAELKNTFCVTRHTQALVSQHIGDLSEYSAYEFFQEGIADLVQLLKVKPEIVVHDMHPDYLSTRFAREYDAPHVLAVQHHHAHMAACMAEHELDEEVIGVVLDGTGYGSDGTVWGGEFFVADLARFTRVAHFKRYPLPGGDACVLNPVRMAMSCLMVELGCQQQAKIRELLPDLTDEEYEIVSQMVIKGLRSPLTSSAGRLFDAVSALLGICSRISYEGQAAIKLQSLASPDIEERYPFDVLGSAGDRTLSFSRALIRIIDDMASGKEIGTISARFHNTLAAAVASVCETIRSEHNLSKVVLSGGVFQNALLLRLTCNSLQNSGLSVYTHEHLPPNDAGISLGQAAVALALSRSGSV